MTQDIEVELRGPLDESQYNQLLSTLQKDDLFIEKKHRLLLDYSVFLAGEGVRDRKLDIRLRITNGVPEIITKIGGWGGDEHRREISIKTETGSFDRLVETYGLLGYTKAIIAERFTKVFTYKGFEFALVTVPDHSYYFEIEAMAHQAQDIEGIKLKMRSICDDLGISLFTDETFFAYIERLNTESNGVFDFANFEPDYFAKRYKI